MSETAKWLKSREDWLRVIAIPGAHGGFDIALVIDGTYAVDSGVRRLVRSHAERLMAALKADGTPLGRPVPVGVRPSIDAAADYARRREAACQAIRKACEVRDLDGLFEAMSEAVRPPLDEFVDLEDAFHGDE